MQDVVPLAKRYGVKLELMANVTERAKFAVLKTARLLVYPSLFEGFGLPPVEALYCGSQVVAFDLEVLQEVHSNSQGIRFVRRGDFGALGCAVMECASQPSLRDANATSVANIASFERFARELSSKLESAVISQ